MKIIGQLVCGPGEADRYLKETLFEFSRLCDEVIVCLCNATWKEKNLCNKYGFAYYEDNREWGKEQPNIKTDLLKRILLRNPDWILVLDADETVPTIKSREELEALTIGREACQMYVVNLWNDEQHYKKSSAFWNVRFYKADESKGTQFLRKAVHCGNAPPYFYSIPAKHSYVPHILLHKGLMSYKERLRRVDRYALYDPNAIHKGPEYYEMLGTNNTGAEYVESEVLNKIQEFCKTL